MRKPYKARSIRAAERRVRELTRIVDAVSATLERYAVDRRNLAKLAATGPAFDNPLHVFEVQKLRDDILRTECRLGPDGKFLDSAT